MNEGRVRRIIGVGQPIAGDDAVGLEVVRRIRREGAPDGVALDECAEPSRLVPLLEDVEAAVIVDAAVADPPAGRVLTFDPDDVAVAPVRLLSTHGVGVAQAVALARAARPDAAPARITIVAVTIAAPARPGSGLSPDVAAAVPRAAAAARHAIGR